MLPFLGHSTSNKKAPRRGVRNQLRCAALLDQRGKTSWAPQIPLLPRWNFSRWKPGPTSAGLLLFWNIQNARQFLQPANDHARRYGAGRADWREPRSASATNVPGLLVLPRSAKIASGWFDPELSLRASTEASVRPNAADRDFFSTGAPGALVRT